MIALDLIREMLVPRVGFTVSEEELELIHKKANELGISVGEYAYRVVMEAIKK